ncbi:hypothetical protein Tco_1492637 [Tanacetum coccineum]
MPLSAINTALILSSKAAGYIIRVSPLMGAVTVDSASKSSFILQKASSAFAVHWTIFPLVQLLSVRLKGSVLSALFERKRFRAANFLLRFYISLTDLGGCRSEIAFTFEGLAFIPCLVMRCPDNIPSTMPKEHFFGLSFKLIALSPSRVSLISVSPPIVNVLGTPVIFAFLWRLSIPYTSHSPLSFLRYLTTKNAFYFLLMFFTCFSLFFFRFPWVVLGEDGADSLGRIEFIAP